MNNNSRPKLKSSMIFGAEDRNRTGTFLSKPRILRSAEVFFQITNFNSKYWIHIANHSFFQFRQVSQKLGGWGTTDATVTHFFSP
jgi:hypothetical protein